MNQRQLNWNIPLYFYDSILGETALNTHQKTTAVPRYDHDTVFHENCVIQIILKMCLSNIFIFRRNSFE